MSSVFIENISSNSKIKLLPLKRLCQKILNDFRKEGELNIILVSDSYMRQLNQRFTKSKGTTDVLSFSFKEEKSLKGNRTFLGEVYISTERAKKQAKDYQVSFQQELRRLLAHGVLHLLGYKHKTKKDEDRMRKKEKEYI